MMMMRFSRRRWVGTIRRTCLANAVGKASSAHFDDVLLRSIAAQCGTAGYSEITNHVNRFSDVVADVQSFGQPSMPTKTDQ